jgi:hypothetical protein
MEPQGSQPAFAPITADGSGRLPANHLWMGVRSQPNRNGPHLHRVFRSGTAAKHTKLRVALVCLVWGEEFADFFARYCIPSLLEPQNIPLVSRDHDVTLLLCTDRPTQEFLDRCDSFKSLSRFAKIELLPLEQLPAAARTNHWVPWQHAVAGCNRDFDPSVIIPIVSTRPEAGTIIDAPEEHDTVYYTPPQVLGTVAPSSTGRRSTTDTSASPAKFSSGTQSESAAAACSSTFFVNHPEIAIKLAKEHGRSRDRIASAAVGWHSSISRCPRRRPRPAI